MGNLALNSVLMNSIGCEQSVGINSGRHNMKQEKK
jgi:hypothetical protein